MSTKIYNGCRAPRDLDVFELADRIRAAVTPVRRRLEAEELVRRAAVIIDHDVIHQVRRAGAKNNRLRWSPLVTAIQDYRADQTGMDDGYALHDPFRFSVQIIPNGDHLYLLPYFLKDEYLDALTDIDGVEHYPYYNNTEEPEGTTRAEWVARGKEWDAVPGVGKGVPGEHGVTVELGMQNTLMTAGMDGRGDLAKYQPSVREREINILTDVAAKLTNFSYCEDGDPWTFSMSGYNKMIRKVTEAVDSKEDVITGVVPLTESMLVGDEAHPGVQIDVTTLCRFLAD